MDVDPQRCSAFGQEIICEFARWQPAGVQEEASPLANATFRFDRSARCSEAQTQTVLVLARLHTTQTPTL